MDGLTLPKLTSMRMLFICSWEFVEENHGVYGWDLVRQNVECDNPSTVER